MSLLHMAIVLVNNCLLHEIFKLEFLEHVQSYKASFDVCYVNVRVECAIFIKVNTSGK